MTSPHTLTPSSNWNVLFIWFSVSTVILTLGGNWEVVMYVLTFGCLYGGLVYRFRHGIRKFMTSHRLNRYHFFLVVSIAVSVLEELYVYSLSIRIAVPDIWRDIIIVSGEWVVWLSTWYLFVAGLEGLLFECLGTRLWSSSIAGFMIFIPTTVIVYSAIFILPMQLIDFNGKRDTIWKYPGAVFLPYVLTVPVAFILYALFY